MPFTYRPFCQWLELFSHSSCFISMDSQLGDNASSKWISLKAHLEMLRGSLHPTASAQMHGADLKATMSVPECIRLYSKNDHTDVNSEKKRLDESWNIPLADVSAHNNSLWFALPSCREALCIHRMKESHAHILFWEMVCMFTHCIY